MKSVLTAWLLNSIYLASIFYLSSCGSSLQEDVLVSAYGEELTTDETKNIVPKGSTAKDSIEIMEQFIESWMKKRAILNVAKNNMTDPDFNKQIEEYKNALIIYNYEQELVKQKLDTTVTDKEINAFYELNKESFTLKENIVKVHYIKLPANSQAKIIMNAKQLLQAEKKEKLNEFCLKHAVNFYLDDEAWLFFNDLLKEIPIQTYNQENFLRNNRIIEMKDSAYTYLLHIKDFKIRESISPLSFEKANIRDMILNKRKVKLIRQTHEIIYKEAIKNNDFKIKQK